jgi:hypothetical protein
MFDQPEPGHWFCDDHYDPGCVETAYEAGLYYIATGKKPYSGNQPGIGGAEIVSIAETMIEKLDQGINQ